ncbi:MAG: YtxH domain-containing protein [Chloroflexota bacterium]|nr:YtxH domain-containing protein [Chloroflexota bacterium]
MAANNLNNRMYYSRDAEIRAERDRLMLAALVAIVGVGFGMALAMLFAPQSGDKTRRGLVDAAGNFIENVQQTVEKAVQQ